MNLILQNLVVDLFKILVKEASFREFDEERSKLIAIEAVRLATALHDAISDKIDK